MEREQEYPAAERSALGGGMTERDSPLDHESSKREPLARWNAAAVHRRNEERARGKESRLAAEMKSRQMEAAAPRPVAELLACPAATGNLLTSAAQSLTFDPGEIVFRQSSRCAGLYLIVQGQFLRRTERMNMRVALGLSRPGDLIELAAVLGDGRHTYSLVSQNAGSLLLLPREALQDAFESYPPLRMQLLEELAREVSRAYLNCGLTRGARTRRRLSSN